MLQDITIAFNKLTYLILLKEWFLFIVNAHFIQIYPIIHSHIYII